MAKPALVPDDVEVERTLPHSLEAERSVLGAILLYPESLEAAGEVLSPRHFFRTAHRQIFETMLRLSELSSSVDFVTVKEELARCGELADVGGPAYLSSLVDGMPRPRSVADYAAIVRDKALLRELIYAGNKMVVEAYDAKDDAREVMLRADRIMLELQAGHDRRGLARQDSTALFNDLEQRVANKGRLTGLETGFASLNDLTLGWQRGDLVLIGARPSIGKTTFAMNTAVAAARTGKHVAIFSFEMRTLQLEYRMLSSLSGVTLSRMLSGYLIEPDWEAVSGALRALDAMPIYITDRGGQTVGDVRMACRRQRAETGLDMIVVDYVQLMPGSIDRRGATRNDEMTDISRRLKLLADELEIPVLVLSQLSRAAEGRADPRPRLSDLRESGSLEQDADIVCLLHRKHHREGGLTTCIVEKQRNGPAGTVNLTLDRDITTFIDGGEEKPLTAEEVETQKQEQKRMHFRRRAHAGR